MKDPALLPVAPRPEKSPPDRTARPGRPSDADEIRSRILVAGMSVFSRKGFADASVEDLLEEASLARRTFYRYFRSKDEVLDTLHERVHTLLIQTMANLYDSEQVPEVLLRDLVDGALRFYVNAGPITRVFQVEATRPESFLASRRGQIMETLAEFCAIQIQRIVGSLPDPWVVRGILAAIEAIAVEVVTTTDREDADIDRGRDAALAVLEGTLHSLRLRHEGSVSGPPGEGG